MSLKLLQNNNTVYTDRCRVFRGLSSAAKLAERYEPETLVEPEGGHDAGKKGPACSGYPGLIMFRSY